MEAGDCPTLNMNAKENYLFSQSLNAYSKMFIVIIHVIMVSLHSLMVAGRNFSFIDCAQG